MKVGEGPGLVCTWLIKGLLLLLTGFFLLLAAATLIGDSAYLAYLATKATVFDMWAVLSIVSTLLSLTAIVGAGLALWCRKLILAFGFAVLGTPTHVVIEGSRCDTFEACRLMSWAALPSKALSWEIRLRPVEDANEAEAIASAALSRTDRDTSPFKVKQFGDHWIVSAIDHDGWPAAHAVRIDTRSARTSLIPCPADKIQCGMERPRVSDGRSAFRNDRLGLVAIFPASRAVCTSRADDGEPRGLFAMVRAPDIPCDILDASREMGVEIARSGKNGCISVAAKSVPWRALSPETEKLFQSPLPTLGGRPSVICELHEHDQIQISIYASAPSLSPTEHSRETLYEAYIVTTPVHLVEDILSFEAFLKTLRIGQGA